MLTMQHPSPVNHDVEIKRIIWSAVLWLCRNVIFPDVCVKLYLYGIVVILSSLVRSFNASPTSTFLQDKRNFLNVYFVKIGWAWLLAVCTPFVFLTNSFLRGNHQFDKLYIGRGLISCVRLLVATVCWKVVTSVFVYAELSYGGHCLVEQNRMNATTRHECKQVEGSWVPFLDISGHVFLLTFCCLIMCEESKTFLDWMKMGGILTHGGTTLRQQHVSGQNRENVDLALESDAKTKHILASYQLLNPYVRVTYVAQAILTVVYEVMLVSTCLYFHTFVHKAVAYLFSVCCWYAIYKVVDQHCLSITSCSLNNVSRDY